MQKWQMPFWVLQITFRNGPHLAELYFQLIRCVIND